MIMMLVRHGFVARTAVPEVVPLDHAGIFEQLDRPVDGGNRNARINGNGAAVEFFNVRDVRRMPASITEAITRRCSVMRMPFATHISASVDCRSSVMKLVAA